MKLSSLFLLFLAIASGYADICIDDPSNVAIEQCHEEAYHDHLFFSDCEKMPCQPKLGDSHTLNVHFKPSHNARSVKVKFSLILDFGHPSIDFMEDEDSDACQYFNVTCPIHANQPISYNHTFTLPRKKLYTMVPVKMEWQLINPANRQRLACIRVPVHMMY